MGMKIDKSIWVVGHKNPDTDSICSAIAYARLKNKISKKAYTPKRAGEINEETKYVLSAFEVTEPDLITDVGAQVLDAEIYKKPGVSGKISLKAAWEMMKENNKVTLPVTDSKNYLEGLIITADIATSYMDVYDNRILARSKTPYQNIIETLNGTMICGNEHAIFSGGKVLVGAANPEVMEEFIEDNDLVITGTRYEAQLCALQANASCIVIAGNPKVSKSIISMAKQMDCVLITTEYDTYTAARLINQSMPIKYFMRKENLITFDTEDYIDDIKEVMSKSRHRDFPIIEEDGTYVGMISRRNLLNLRKKQLILVDHNEKSQAVAGVDGADILEIIDHHRIGSLETMSPVYFRNQPVGCTATIVTQMYDENRIEIDSQTAGLLLSAILSDTLMFRSPTCTKEDKSAAERLAKLADVDIETHAKAMFAAGSNFKSKTEQEIFYQDFKPFNSNGIDFGVGQLSAMTQEELDDVKERLLPYLGTVLVEKGLDMVFLMLTNIIEETTHLICLGEKSDDIVKMAYHQEKINNEYILEGVVSRKKQLIPSFMATLTALV